MLHRVDMLKETLSSRQKVHLTLITTYGLLPGKHSGKVGLKKHIAYKICFIREIRVRSPSSYHSDSQQLFTMRM